ncbi:MAG TPA: sulfatase-like hydrolase/transferase [Thermoanaerobaculia bacterium]|nr:sulfatase-like hydrolase/transferase [Thermoanaerobaculia bacterium]
MTRALPDNVRIPSRALIAIGLFAFLAAACPARRSAQTSASSAPSDSRRDVILITIDTLRADSLGYAGNTRVRTPNLDRLAAEGTVFTAAHAHNVMTLPSHVNILTGLYPYQHGVRDNEGFRLDPKIPTLASILKARGYATAAVIGAFPLDGRFGLSHDFDLYDQRYPQGAHEYDFTVAERSASEVVAVAREWFGAQGDRPRFLWVHLYDCHSPYRPPPSVAAAYPDAPYLGEVAGVDEALAPLLADVRASSRPKLLVMTADHGESLGEHGETTHGLFAYEATLHVPLLLWGDGVSAGTKRGSARHVDIAPTILSAAGAAASGPLPGRSLLGAGESDEPSYFEALDASLTRGWAPLRGIVWKGAKFIELPVPELYDLSADPAESRNLVGERLDLVRSLRPRLEGTRAVAAASSESRETAARLRSLGYLSGSASPKARYGPEDDPKNLVALDRDLQRVVSLYHDGKMEDAILLAKRVVRARPTMSMGYEYLSFLLGQTGRDDLAAAALEDARRRGLMTEILASRLGLLYSAQRKSKEALAILEPLAGSRNPDVLNALGIARATAGRMPEAIAAFESALSADPANALAWQNIGLTEVQRGRPEEAIAAFDKAFAINDRLPRAWNGRGVALERLGRHDEALEAWKHAVSLDSQQFEALLNLGTIALERGNVGLGQQALRQFVATAPPGLFAEDLRRARRMLAESGAGS